MTDNLSRLACFYIAPIGSEGSDPRKHSTDIFTLVPKLETYRSEIASQVRTALNDTEAPANPISVFFPGFSVVLPTDKKS